MVGLRSLAAAGTAGILGALALAVSSPVMPRAESKLECNVLTARDRIFASSLSRSVKDAAGLRRFEI